MLIIHREPHLEQRLSSYLHAFAAFGMCRVAEESWAHGSEGRAGPRFAARSLQSLRPGTVIECSSDAMVRGSWLTKRSAAHQETLLWKHLKLGLGRCSGQRHLQQRRAGTVFGVQISHKSMFGLRSSLDVQAAFSKFRSSVDAEWVQPPGASTSWSRESKAGKWQYTYIPEVFGDFLCERSQLLNALVTQGTAKHRTKTWQCFHCWPEQVVKKPKVLKSNTTRGCKIWQL